MSLTFRREPFGLDNFHTFYVIFVIKFFVTSVQKVAGQKVKVSYFNSEKMPRWVPGREVKTQSFTVVFHFCHRIFNDYSFKIKKRPKAGAFIQSERTFFLFSGPQRSKGSF